MKSPFDSIKGKIIGYDERSGELLIRAKYDDWPTMIRREYKECILQLIDSRPLSHTQRKSCYAMIGEIADYIGEEKTYTKELMKIEFLANELQETADKIFSLSNAPMSLVASFQRYLVSFIVRNDIPTKVSMLKYVDDIGDYIYQCLIAKKCAVCGRKSDLHHIDHVGLGRDRSEIMHLGMEVMPLCRVHHNECHQIGQKTFNEKYHFDSGIKLDKTLCKIYGIK